MKKSQLINKTLLFLVMLFVSLVMISPFLLTISTSLKPMREIQSPNFTLLPIEPQFHNYTEALRQGDWPRYFLNSFIVTGVTVLLAVVFNSLAGFAFARLKFKGSKFLFFFMLIGIMVPAQVTLIPTFFMMKNFSLAGGNNLLGQGGTGLLDSLAGLIIPYAAGSFGIFLCRQFYLNFPNALDEAADLDGASKWQLFTRIYLPLSKPIIATLVITKSSSIWNDYLWPMVLTQSSNVRTVQLGLTIFRNDTVIQWNYLMAATVMVVLPLVVLFFFLQKYYIAGVVASGIKG